MKTQLEINQEILESKLKSIDKQTIDIELLSRISPTPRLYKLLIEQSKRFIERHSKEYKSNNITEGFFAMIYNESYYNPKYNHTVRSSYLGFGPKLTSLIEQYFQEKQII